MGGRSSRNKGAAAEREFTALLTEHLGVKCQRKLGQARDGGDDVEVPPFRIEVKRRETLAIKQWCKQVEACTAPNEIPVVAFRQNGEPWRVVLRLEDFYQFMRGEIGSGDAT